MTPRTYYQVQFKFRDSNDWRDVEFQFLPLKEARRYKDYLVKEYPNDNRDTRIVKRVVTTEAVE